MNPTGAWTRSAAGRRAAARRSPQTPGCAAARARRPRDYLQCLGPDAFIKDVFLDSDTDLTVLSFVPSTRDGRAADDRGSRRDARASSSACEGTHRLYLHGRVNPNQAGDLEDMDVLARQYPHRRVEDATRSGDRTGRASSSTTTPASR